MRVQIESACWYEWDDLIKRYPALIDFNITKEVTGDYSYEFEAYITLESIDDLFKLIDKLDKDLVLCKKDKNGAYSILIYDTWIE